VNYMNIRASWFAVALLVILASVANFASAGVLAGEKIKTGTIQKLNFSEGSMILDGNRYHTAPELRVEIAGSYGAFTMLEVGMKVQIVYRVESAVRRDVVEIKEIPSHVTIEEA